MSPGSRRPGPAGPTINHTHGGAGEGGGSLEVADRLGIPTYASDADAPDSGLFLNTGDNLFKYKDSDGSVQAAAVNDSGGVLGGQVVNDFGGSNRLVLGPDSISFSVEGGVITAGIGQALVNAGDSIALGAGNDGTDAPATAGSPGQVLIGKAVDGGGNIVSTPNAVAIGTGATVESVDSPVAIGAGATVSGGGSGGVAIGSGATAQANAIAIRRIVNTINVAAIGGEQLVFGGVADTIADADLENEELTVEYDEASSEFRVRGKDSTGTVNTATVGGVTEHDTGTVTATGGSTPAVDTTLTNVGMDQTAPHDLNVYVDADPGFNANYAYNYEWGFQWDDANSEVDINLTVNWDTDPGAGNDVTLRWELVSP